MWPLDDGAASWLLSVSSASAVSVPVCAVEATANFGKDCEPLRMLFIPTPLVFCTVRSLRAASAASVDGAVSLDLPFSEASAILPASGSSNGMQCNSDKSCGSGFLWASPVFFFGGWTFVAASAAGTDVLVSLDRSVEVSGLMGGASGSANGMAYNGERSLGRGRLLESLVFFVAWSSVSLNWSSKASVCLTGASGSLNGMASNDETS